MNFIIYDLEATCWMGRPPGLVQETIEIGAVMVNGYGEELGSFNKFIKPIVNPLLSSFCRELTSITQTEIDRAGTFPKVIDEFQDWIDCFDDHNYLLCSWGSFDKTMLIKDCELHKLDSDWLEAHLNLKDQYQHFKKLNRPCGLKAAVKKEGFEFTGTPHRGISDAENLAKVFVKHLDVWQY
jgi:3'-5' exoribonuclease 1